VDQAGDPDIQAPIVQMQESTLHIRNMVCNRCIRVVSEEMDKLGYHISSIELGNVVLREKLEEEDRKKIAKVLGENGFELIDGRKGWLVNRIKTLIIEYVHHGLEIPASQNLSDYLVSELGHDYSYMSHLFSSMEGITIEKYLIHQKIEKTKELLVYDELTLNEIALRLDYSSVQHLSSQFKKVTGLTPSHFKKLKDNKRMPLDQV